MIHIEPYTPRNTTDVIAPATKLVPHKDSVTNASHPVGVGMHGGMARYKTIINDVRRQNKNIVVMNIGDTFHGGVQAFYTLGNAVADPLNALGIDVGVAGNWDYTQLQMRNES